MTGPTHPQSEPRKSGSHSIEPILDTLFSLIRIIEEESELLALSGSVADVSELASAKALLASRLDQIAAERARENPDWMETLTSDERATLTAAIEELNRAAVVNSDILERQIDLSSEMLHAVGQELERLTGRHSTTYGRRGDMRARRVQMPLSINTRL